MKRQSIAVLVLLIGILVSSSIASAEPPDPVKVTAVVYPPQAHVGDTVTLRCQVIPLRGDTVRWLSISFTGGLLELTEVRSFEEHGPVIWEYTLNTSTPGTYVGGCAGGLLHSWASASATFVILP